MWLGCFLHESARSWPTFRFLSLDQKVSYVVTMKSFERHINVATAWSHWLYNSGELHGIKHEKKKRFRKKIALGMGFIMDNRWHHFVVQFVKDAFWKVFLPRITQGIRAYIHMNKEFSWNQFGNTVWILYTAITEWWTAHSLFSPQKLIPSVFC